MNRALFMVGSEFVAAALPEEASVIAPPPPRSGVPDLRAAVSRALEAPLDGLPLSQRVKERDRVLVVFDPPVFPVPPMRVDPRTAMIEAILAALTRRGLALEQVALLCATGATRLYRNTELAPIVGVGAMASHRVTCHDLEASDSFTSYGVTAEGEPVELNSALSRADLVITVSLVQLPLQGGYSTLIGGLASARTSQAIYSASNLAEGPTPFAPQGSAWQKALRRAGKLAEKQLDVFHVELALGTHLGSGPMAGRLSTALGPPRPLAAWNRLPEPLRARASRLFRSEYQLLGVITGSTEKVHARALELLDSNCTVAVEAPVDIAILGVPAVNPWTSGTQVNPLQTAVTAFGYMLAWHKGQPIFKRDGTVILLTPLTERFDKARQAPHAAFYEKVLSKTRDPAVMSRDYEAQFASRPDYVNAYRRKFALHGLHPFQSWYQAAGTLARCGRVFVVGADARPAERLGFQTCATLEDALAAAREHIGQPRPSIAALAMPPIFGLAVG